MTEANGKGAKSGADEPGLVRVLAPNPSPMTGAGTWTHLLGREDVAIIDPGPDDPAHLAAIIAALPPGARVTAIIVTHAHLDHSALARRLSDRVDAPVLAFGTASDGRSIVMQGLVAAGLTGGGEGIDRDFRPDRRLSDSEAITGAGWQLTALHTPGHMGGHLCLAWDDILFSGDHVMDWAPSLVSPPDGDMGAYMASLNRLAATPWRRMLPAHGGQIDHPAQRLAELTAHRRKREAQILAAIAQGARDLSAITASVYSDLAAALRPAAQRNALAHLIDLAERNLVIAHPAPSPLAIWTRI